MLARHGLKARKGGLVAGGFAAAVIAAVAGVASGATVESSKTCAVSLSALKAGQTESVARTIGCWATVSEAETALGLSQTPALGAGPVLAASQTLIGRDYGSTGFLGSQKIWFAADTHGCTDGSTYSYPMPADFNNLTRSAQGFAGCNHNTHYDPPSASGANITCASACASMGAMDLKTSFVRWSP